MTKDGRYTVGEDTLVSMSDTPDDLTGQAGNVLRVNGTEDAFEFWTVPVGEFHVSLVSIGAAIAF